MSYRAQLRFFSVAFGIIFGAATGASAAAQAVSRSAQVTLIARMPDDVTMLVRSAAVALSVSPATPRSPLRLELAGHLLPGANVTAACFSESKRLAMRSRPAKSSWPPIRTEFACDGRFRTLSPTGPHAATVEISAAALQTHTRSLDHRLDITLSVI